MPTCLAWENYHNPAVDVIDWDFNDDGCIDVLDLVILCNCILSNATYDRELDINFDGSIDVIDLQLMCNHLLDSSLCLCNKDVTIEDYKFTVHYNGKNYTIFAVRPQEVKDVELNYLRITLHPYKLPGYTCFHFSVDSYYALTKVLGYGRVGFATSTYHAYLIMYTGGDPSDLRNWMILEPQNGDLVPNNTTNDMYKTVKIMFPYCAIISDNEIRFYTFALPVHNNTVRINSPEDRVLITEPDHPEEANHEFVIDTSWNGWTT